MDEIRTPDVAANKHSWPLVLSLVGVDYFSTLAYLPSIAVEAAGPYAPIAAGVVVLATFLMALPVYWYVVGRSPDGLGASGILENSIHGWRGKLAVLSLLGFAAADFVITRCLSLADAAIHLIHNPHGQHVLQRLPADLIGDGRALWPPLELLIRRLLEPQVAITLGLAITSFGLWQWLKRGLTRRILIATVAAVCCYLALTALVVGSALFYVARHPPIREKWLQTVFQLRPLPDPAGNLASGPVQTSPGGIGTANANVPANHSWKWAWFSIALWSFPQMALGLSGFEMIMTVAPQVSGGTGATAGAAASRAGNTRKLMLASASIMAVYLVSAVLATTLLVPREALGPKGAAQHRALAYLAHGSPLEDGADGTSLNPMFGHLFGDLFDLSSVMILCLAGATVTLGLQNLLPYYLHRFGMEVRLAGSLGLILHVLNAMVLLITVVFQASPSSQQWAYATSVLVLIAGAALAAAVDLRQRTDCGWKRFPLVALACGSAGFFLAMTGLTVLINHSGLTIAMAFVLAILVSSFLSRWIRSTELRFKGFDFADDQTRDRWKELCHSGPKVLVPHRPGRVSIADKSAKLQREYRLDPATTVIFIEAQLGDPSNFYQKPRMQIESDGKLEVIRVSQCVSVSHVLAAMCVELCRSGGTPPEMVFGWSRESPLAANLNFLLLGEGNIPWMVKELVSNAIPDETRAPRIVVG